MKIDIQLYGMPLCESLDSLIKESLKELHMLIAISYARVVLERQCGEASVFQAYVYLTVAGPDIHASVRDHTPFGAWHKMIANLKKQFERLMTQPQFNIKRGEGTAIKPLSNIDGVQETFTAFDCPAAQTASRTLGHLLANNRAWACQVRTKDPEFFEKLSHQQTPKYFWIGCSDSRVPANQITGLLPGEMFVHRNIANVVPMSDLNCLSTIQFAVDVLKVQHIIVCGHYGCAGILAVLKRYQLGLVDIWLRNVDDVRRKHGAQMDALGDEARQFNRLCELNVIEQVANVCNTAIVQKAWDRGQPLTVHGWIYAINDGLLNDLSVSINSSHEIDSVCQAAIAGQNALQFSDELFGGINRRSCLL